MEFWHLGRSVSPSSVCFLSNYTPVNIIKQLLFKLDISTSTNVCARKTLFLITPSLAVKDLPQSPEPVDILVSIVPALRNELEHSVHHGVTEAKCRSGELVDDGGIDCHPY